MALRNQGQLQELQGIEERIAERRGEATSTVAKIRVLSSPTVLKFMEEDLVRIERHIEALSEEKTKKEVEQPSHLAKVLARVKYFTEHLDELIIQQIDPIKKAQLFGVLFDQIPTVEDITYGTPKTPLFRGVNGIFALANMDKGSLVVPRGFEPLIFPVRGGCPNH